MSRCRPVSAGGRRSYLMLLLLAVLVLGMMTVTSFQVPFAIEPRRPAGPYSAERLRACNLTRANAFFAHQPRDSSPEGEQFRRRGWFLLAAVVRALDRLLVPHWLGSGTLLGHVRQCELAPAMGDVDLEMAAEAVISRGLTVEQLVAAVEAEGARLRHRFGLPADSLELAFEDDHGTRLDLFLSYLAADGSRWIGGIDTGTLQKYKWTYPSVELCWSVLDSLRVGVPCDSSAYLRAFYGDSWRSPPEGVWDYRTGHPNVQDNGHWPEDLRHEVFQSNQL